MEKLSDLSSEERAAIIDKIVAEKFNGNYEAIKYAWDLIARPSQLISIIPDSNWRIACWCAGRGIGKGASLKTRIPTTFGWTTMGQIKVGDQVFDENGNVCNVTAVTDEYMPKKAYRFEFSDGTFIDVCDQHQWISWDHLARKSYLKKDRINHLEINNFKFPDDWVNWSRVYRKSVNKPKIRISEEIVNSFYYGKRNDLNHCIPLCKPLKLDEKDLPIPSYLLGLWLGDGNSNAPCITCHIDDFQFYSSYLSNLGLKLSKFRPDFRSPNTGKFTIYEVFKLKILDLYKNKHVPDLYLRGSEKQRLELVQGLLDSDGNICKEGRIEFYNTNKLIFDAAYELLVSLGQKPIISTRIGKLNGKSYKLCYRLGFRPNRFDLFKLPRKLKILKDSLKYSQQLRNHHRMLISYKEISPLLMKCIQVDSKNSMYLIGDGMIPTHNTFLASQAIRQAVESGGHRELLLVAPTSNDVISTNINGPSGILAVCPPWNKPEWSPTYKQLVWPNGARMIYRSADEPERIRGANISFAVLDELAAANYGKEAFDMTMFALRLGNPKCIITTTPKPLAYLLEIFSRTDCYVITGSSLENAANIDLSVFLEQYQGTRLGRQEIYGELLFDNPDSLWNYQTIEKSRLKRSDNVPELIHIVVAVDPAVSVSKTSAETGISVVGYGIDGHVYILYADGFKMQPLDWAKKVIELYDYYRADRIVVEVNQGGDLVKSNLQQVRPLLPVYSVHATRKKAVRAEPVASLFELGKVHLVGYFPKLEEQLLNFPPSDSKTVIDCMESCVWGVTALMELTSGTQNYAPSVGGQRNKVLDYLKDVSHIY